MGTKLSREIRQRAAHARNEGAAQEGGALDMFADELDQRPVQTVGGLYFVLAQHPDRDGDEEITEWQVYGQWAPTGRWEPEGDPFADEDAAWESAARLAFGDAAREVALEGDYHEAGRHAEEAAPPIIEGACDSCWRAAFVMDLRSADAENGPHPSDLEGPFYLCGHCDLEHHRAEEASL